MTKGMRPVHRSDVLTSALLFYGMWTKEKLGMCTLELSLIQVYMMPLTMDCFSFYVCLHYYIKKYKETFLLLLKYFLIIIQLHFFLYTETEQ